jgi:hypothetical protein
MHHHDLHDLDDDLFFFVHRPHHRNYYRDFADHCFRDCGNANSIPSGCFGRDKQQCQVEGEWHPERR